MNRNVIIAALIGAILLVLLLGGVLVMLIVNSDSNNMQVQAEQIAVRKPRLVDKYAGREADAIAYVKSFQVLAPEYIDAYDESKKTGKPIAADKRYVSIESLVNAEFLENRFNMNFLKRGEWRALHLDTDTGVTQKPDPQYEVYLDYQDESVTVGPVWIVDIENRDVFARNDMASIFDRETYNYALINDNLKRPASVVRAITSHKFKVGIDLGGILLLHFMKLANTDEHKDDEIIGWTVMQEFENEFSAYFQWKDRGEIKVAKFRFDWEKKSLEPQGLRAIGLMQLGETSDPVKPVNIYPNSYTNDLNIPAKERWSKGHPCRDSDNAELCGAFVKVLEEQEFVTALSWLLTNGEPDANRRIDRCKEEKKCGWISKPAPAEYNPEKNEKLFEIGYKYELNGREHVIHFLVDMDKNTIKPLDKTSQWAYWSVTPRT